MAIIPAPFESTLVTLDTDCCHYFTGVSELVSASKNNK